MKTCLLVVMGQLLGSPTQLPCNEYRCVSADTIFPGQSYDAYYWHDLRNGQFCLATRAHICTDVVPGLHGEPVMQNRVCTQ